MSDPTKKAPRPAEARQPANQISLSWLFFPIITSPRDNKPSAMRATIARKSSAPNLAEPEIPTLADPSPSNPTASYHGRTPVASNIPGLELLGFPENAWFDRGDSAKPATRYSAFGGCLGGLTRGAGPSTCRIAETAARRATSTPEQLLNRSPNHLRIGGCHFFSPISPHHFLSTSKPRRGCRRKSGAWGGGGGIMVWYGS